MYIFENILFSFFIDTAHLRGDLHLPFPHLDAGTPPPPFMTKQPG